MTAVSSRKLHPASGARNLGLRPRRGPHLPRGAPPRARHARQHRGRAQCVVPRVRAARKGVRVASASRVPARDRDRLHAPAGEQRARRARDLRAGHRRRPSAALVADLRRRSARCRRRCRSRWRWSWSRSRTIGDTGSRTRSPTCGGSIPCTTASSSWTGPRRRGCIRSTRPSRRRSRCSRSSCSATTRVSSRVSPCSSRLLAIFQHANVRLRFPGLRWIVNTPEWHHWHHARDVEARNTNFGLPVVDKLFGTAYLPKGRRPDGFGIDDPVPATGYVAHLAYPFTALAHGRDPRGVVRRRRAPAR